MNYASFSTDTHPDYMFFAPLTAMMWQEIVGYGSVVALVGDEWRFGTSTRSPFGPMGIVSTVEWRLGTAASKHLNVVLDELHRLGALVRPVPSLAGYRDSTLAQVSRLYGWLGMGRDEFVIVTDVDMWPLHRAWFQVHGEIASSQLAVLYANNMERFPICYVGARPLVWSEITGLSGLKVPLFHDAEVRYHLINFLSPTTAAPDAWQHDEEWLTNRIHSWPGYPDRCVFVKRALGEPPADRLDRAAWGTKGEHHIDAHLLRPGHSAANWKLIRELIPLERRDWADDYRDRYVKALP